LSIIQSRIAELSAQTIGTRHWTTPQRNDSQLTSWPTKNLRTKGFEI